jgi:hypothetical protein
VSAFIAEIKVFVYFHLIFLFEGFLISHWDTLRNTDRRRCLRIERFHSMSVSALMPERLKHCLVAFCFLSGANPGRRVLSYSMAQLTVGSWLKIGMGARILRDLSFPQQVKT